jgi:hypothetical protein
MFTASEVLTGGSSGKTGTISTTKEILPEGFVFSLVGHSWSVQITNGTHGDLANSLITLGNSTSQYAGVELVWDGTKFREISRSGVRVGITTLADEATPSVAGGSLFTTGGTANDPITDFDDGVVGQTITIKAKHAVQITDGGDLELAGNFVMASGDTITLTMFETGKWSEISRSDTT